MHTDILNYGPPAVRIKKTRRECEREYWRGVLVDHWPIGLLLACQAVIIGSVVWTFF